MGKINVYLPDELEAAMRQAKLVPSHLLQAAIRKELKCPTITLRCSHGTLTSQRCDACTLDAELRGRR